MKKLFIVKTTNHMFLLADPPLPPDFFTVQSMTTLLGATGIVVAVCGGVQRVFNYHPRWLGLVIVIIVTVTGTIFSKAETSVMQYVIGGVMNGFLVHASSSGASHVIGWGTNAPGAKPAGSQNRLLNADFFRRVANL